MIDQTSDRDRMVQTQLANRGIDDEKVLAAMRSVARENFVPARLREFAYQDSALPIEEEQTISQPYIVASMVQAAEVSESDRVLEIGTGSGYAAAVLAEIAEEVVTIERHQSLARTADERLRALEYENVQVIHADGTLGWPKRAPYGAIVVSAGGPEVPEPLLQQLRIGGRMVIPVGPARLQQLIRIRRTGDDDYERKELGGVAFVPLIGEAGWRGEGSDESESQVGTAEEVGSGAASAGSAATRAPARGTARASAVVEVIRARAEPVFSIEEADLSGLLERVGDARVPTLAATSASATIPRSRVSSCRSTGIRTCERR